MTSNLIFPTIKGYAVYNPATGLWSRGGIDVKWSKKAPKIWTGLGTFKNHIAQHVYSDCYRSWNDNSNRRVTNFFYVINHKYEGCQVIDVTTQQPAKDFTVDDCLKYLINHAKKSYGFNGRELEVRLPVSNKVLRKKDLIEMGLL